ncbi:interferon-stimulated gene 20 kDa protein-like [Engystomops pustulosus]|uniref:interferon-stimulated gene 20 kDa protein-like n=1 Tax=Engystomops pustulosus TaxID=76066 RepID=UPI003AFB04A1
MDCTTSSDPFHEFSGSVDYLKESKLRPVHKHNDKEYEKRRLIMKIKSCLSHKAFQKERKLLEKTKSKEPSASPPKYSPACVGDSGSSVAGSSPPSPVSFPSLSQKPRNYVAIDCEMVGCGPRGKINELARCSIVNYKGETIYDEYIKPEQPITSYRTRWSGITPKHMLKAVPFKTARKEILKLLNCKIVIGHAIHNDFKVLKYYHPEKLTRDTIKIRQLYKKAGLQRRQEVSLKKFAAIVLRKQIQVGHKGHSSVEDAQTTMELFKSVEDELEDEQLSHKEFFRDLYWPTAITDEYK